MKKCIVILLCFFVAIPLCVACQNDVSKTVATPSSQIHESSLFIRQGWLVSIYPKEDVEMLCNKVHDALTHCATEYGIALEELPTAREYVVFFLTYGFGAYSNQLPTGVYSADCVFSEQENIQGECEIAVKIAIGYHGNFGMYEESVVFLYIGNDMKCILYPNESAETGKGIKFLCRPVVMEDSLRMVQAANLQHSTDSGARLIEELSGLYDDDPRLKRSCVRAFTKQLQYVTDPSYYPEFVTSYLKGTPEDYAYTINLVDAEGNMYSFTYEPMKSIVHFNGELVYYHFNPS